ncbi:hypothetical protein B0H13DRAFT_1918126 [Mycena leptocephala]|nr:hypothetical protein B0H13DRAFT_1918126 [Mycena leptocephala]
MSGHFRDFGKELGVTDPKSLEDVYKTHLEYIRCTGPNALANIDSARGNLAGTFVNAFVNAGFGNDKLMVEAEEGNSWMHYGEPVTWKSVPCFLITVDEQLGMPAAMCVRKLYSHLARGLTSSDKFGKPRMVSGFQTRQTPVRLATEEFISFGHVLEGFIILQKNQWEKEAEM